MGMREHLRTLVIRISFVDCASELVRLKVPETVTDKMIQKEMAKKSKQLYENDTYGCEGLSADTLFRHICEKHPEWHYSTLTPNFEWTDLDV